MHISAQNIELRRLTVSPPTALNLHPVLSADSQHIIFESTFNPLTNEAGYFQTLQLDLSHEQTAFQQLAVSRAAISTISASGSHLAFTSTDDPLGENPDGNSEVFFYDGSLHQITHSKANTSGNRTKEGCFHPWLDRNARQLVFTCNREPVNNSEAILTLAIYLYDIPQKRVTKIVDGLDNIELTKPQISGDGHTLIFVRARMADSHMPLHSLVTFNLINHEERILAESPSIALPEVRAISDNGKRVLYLDKDEKGELQTKIIDTRWSIQRQVVSLSPRKEDIALNPCLSGDGLRVAFATRRRVNKISSSGGVQVYLYDFPSSNLMKVTEAPTGASAEANVSLNGDGTSLVFNFPRILSDPDTSAEDANNSEIYLAKIPLEPRSVETLKIFHGATPQESTTEIPSLAPSQIAFVRAQHLAVNTEYARPANDQSFPYSLGGTTILVGNTPAQIIYASPSQVNFIVPSEVSLGETVISVKNIDDYETRGRALIVRQAPGLFTVSGDGHGAGIFLQSNETLTSSNIISHWMAYATGLDSASEVTYQINGIDIPQKPGVASCAELPGLSQIEFGVPDEWRGAGKVSFNIKADDVQSNTVDFDIGAALEGDLLINEVLADPPLGLAGDANHDGIRDGTNDEFIELVNPTTQDLIINNWTVSVRALTETKEKVVHRFGNFRIPAGDATVIFGGGNFDPLDPIFGGAQIVKASNGNLALSNNSGVLMVRDATGKLINEFSYGTAQDTFGGNSVNQSITRWPDIKGQFVLHSNANNQKKIFSPGTRIDGSFFVPRKGMLSAVKVSPSKLDTIVGGTLPLSVTAFDQYGRVMTGISFTFALTDQTVAEIIRRGQLITETSLRGLHEGSTDLVVSATGGLRNLKTLPLPVRINPAPPHLIKFEVEPQQIILNRGVTKFLSVRALAENYQLIPETKFAFHSSNPSLLQIDENGSMHALAPGQVKVTVKASDNYGGEVSGEIDVIVRLPLSINEVLADVPPDDPKTLAIEGDANHDGVRNSDDDEFIELINNSTEAVDISGVTINDANSIRFTFPEKTFLRAGGVAVVFGGGAPDVNSSTFGGAQIFAAKSLGLKDSGDSISLKIKAGEEEVVIQSLTYGSGANNPAAPANQSLVSLTEPANGYYTAHSLMPHAANRAYSPGTRSDGTPFESLPVSKIIVTTGATATNAGDDVLINARAFAKVGDQEVELHNVSFTWDADNAQRSALTNLTGAATTWHHAQAGITHISARAGGLEGIIVLTVNQVVKTVELNPKNVEATVGQSITLTASARDTVGAVIQGLTFNFSLRDETAAGIAVVEKTTDDSVTLKIKSDGSLKVAAKYLRVDGEAFEAISDISVKAAAPPIVPQPHQLIINEALVSFASSPSQTRNDFIELFNTSDSTLDLSGLTVSYRPSGSGSVVNKISLPGNTGSATVTLAPHGCFLIVNGSETFGVKADFNGGPFDLNNTSGAIKIEMGETKLDGLVYQGGTSAPPGIFVNFGDGLPLRFNSGATNDLIRSPNGTDTQDNAHDFRRQGTATDVTPRAVNPAP